MLDSNEAEPPNNNGGNLKNQSNSREAANRGGSGSGSASGSEQRQLNKLSNWSMHNEDNNATAPPAALTSQQQPAKSSFELYQEAADILGLSCSLCDNCRCLDCQVSKGNRKENRDKNGDEEGFKPITDITENQESINNFKLFNFYYK